MLDFSKFAKNSDSAVTLLKTLSNKHRLMILCALTDSELSVNQLNSIIPIPQSTLSQHLAWLRNSGYVKTRREAQSIFYALHSKEVKAIIAVLHQLYCD